jgi:predicted AAA+ superfamily ATPase
MNVQRQQYLAWLAEMKDDPSVKLIHGARGTGKTTLLKENFYYYLISAGVRSDSFIYIDTEALTEYRSMTEQELFDYIDSRIKFNIKYRIVMDEPQCVPGYLNVVNHFKENHDIYIATSSELLTEEDIPGVKAIQMLPLSISEFAACHKSDERKSILPYITYGGFPGLLFIDNEQVKSEKLLTLQDAILKKDVYNKASIRNKKLFKATLRHLISIRGEYVSSYGISEYLRAKGFDTVTDDTITTYLDHICKAHYLQKINRYDLKQDAVLKTKNKYYLSDPGLGFKRNVKVDTMKAYENIICMELIRLGFKVYVGKNGTKEVSFVAMNDHDRFYIQVSNPIINKSTEKKAVDSFRGLDDGYKKIVVTIDDSESGRLQYGYQHINIWEFLANSYMLLNA